MTKHDSIHELAGSLIGRIVHAVDGLAITTYPRDRLAMIHFQIAIEDFESVRLLLGSGLECSARALMRPQFEAFCRASWMMALAGEGMAESLLDRSANWLGLEEIVKRLDAAPRSDTNPYLMFPFQDIYHRLGHALHDHVHRGHDAMSRMHFANDRSQEAPPDEAALLLLSGNIASCSACFALRIAEKHDESDALGAESTAILQKIVELDLSE